MSSVLHQGRGFETVLVGVRVGVDGQGKPQYNTPVEIIARVVREVTVVETGDGTTVKSIATLWVDGEQTPLPQGEDQLTLEDDTEGVVVERIEARRLGGALNHLRLRMRET